MSRVWLALLLCLLCSARAAAASTDAPVRESQGQGRLLVQPQEHPEGVVRSSGGLELLQSLEAPRPRTARSPQGRAAPPAGALHPVRLRRLVGALDGRSIDVCSPTCERLQPYPTAPPSRR